MRVSAAMICALSTFALSLPIDGEAASRRPFTVADDIGTAMFGDPYTGATKPITVSPDGQLAVVVAERGRLDLNRPEAELRIYRLSDVRDHVLRDVRQADVQPLWAFSTAPYSFGQPVINDLRWVAGSDAFAFVARGAKGLRQLHLADIGSRTVRAMTSDVENVSRYEILDRDTYIYLAQDSTALIRRALALRSQPVVVGTEDDVQSLLMTADKFPEQAMQRSASKGQIWFVRDGRRSVVTDSRAAKPVLGTISTPLSLSPTGKLAIASASVSAVPGDWQGAFRNVRSELIHFAVNGQRDSPSAYLRPSPGSPEEYLLVDLDSGTAKAIVRAPTGSSGGWQGGAVRPSWSDDGTAVLLPSAYIRGGLDPSDPCIVIVDLETMSTTCIAPLRPWSERGEQMVGVAFAAGRRDRALVTVQSRVGLSAKTEIREFQESSPSRRWEQVPSAVEMTSRSPVELSVRQSLNERPVLWASDAKSERSTPVWDPNPQLDSVQLAKARKYLWKDRGGREHIGGLYLPPDHRVGVRYPLVIQTHGFAEDRFRPSGAFPSAFAAQELAAFGMAVLQVRGCAVRQTEDEGPCQVEGYESAIDALVSEGLVDRSRVGIIGFSRTCLYVLATLTASNAIAAASITDGINAGYFQYVLNANQGGNRTADDADRLVGARPFGDGLGKWLKNSPLFRSDRIKAPLQVVALGQSSLLGMWEPFALLRYQNKPVDFVMVNNQYDHILANPVARLASQGGTVDWFRFWLQDSEEPDPAKAEQYVRWRGLRELRDANLAAEKGK